MQLSDGLAAAKAAVGRELGINDAEIKWPAFSPLVASLAAVPSVRLERHGVPVQTVPL
jgi:hypothetical protein